MQSDSEEGKERVPGFDFEFLRNGPASDERDSRRGACFLDQQRICGPDCMAFLPSPPSGTAYQGEEWAHCQVLVNADRVGRHLIVLVQIADRLERSQGRERMDLARPNPMGGA